MAEVLFRDQRCFPAKREIFPIRRSHKGRHLQEEPRRLSVSDQTGLQIRVQLQRALQRKGRNPEGFREAAEEDHEQVGDEGEEEEGEAGE